MLYCVQLIVGIDLSGRNPLFLLHIFALLKFLWGRVSLSKITEIVSSLAEPVCVENGCALWDVEYIREAGQWYLRVYIDKDGGVAISDCEAVSRALDPVSYTHLDVYKRQVWRGAAESCDCPCAG